MASTDVKTKLLSASDDASEGNDKQHNETARSAMEPSTNSKIKTPLSGLEDQFMGKFMSPMFSQMEEAVNRNVKILDEIQKNMEKESEEKRKQDSSKHIPDAIKEYGLELTAIMKHLENLLLYENYEQDGDSADYVKARLKPLDPQSEVTLLSHSISAYVSTLEPTHLKHLANKMVADTTLWLARLFRLENSSAYFHEEEREGLVRVCRLALHRRYPDYASEGFMALQSAPPVIYISAAARPGVAMHLCTQLGLPVSCVATVPLYVHTHKMDVVALERLMAEDAAEGRTPLLVLAYAGTPVLGHVDDLTRVQGLCEKHGVWLHIEGNGVALLTWFTVPTNVRPLTYANSVAINLGGWLGLPALPFTTLYRTPDDASQARAAGLAHYTARLKLSCLPVWLCLQNLGHYGVVEKIEYSVNLAKKVHTTVNRMENLRNVSRNRKVAPQPQGQLECADDPRERNLNALGKYVLKFVSALALCEIENPTVVFRYVRPEENPDNREQAEQQGPGDAKEPSKERQPSGDREARSEGEGGESGSEEGTVQEHSSMEEDEEDKEEEGWRNPYFDSLNIWLCETLKRDCPKVHLAAIEVPHEGVCIRFAPMESIHDYNTSEDEVREFVSCLQAQLSILDATVRQRDIFTRIVAENEKLRTITLPNWAGLGAVQYIPDAQLEALRSEPLSERVQAELNKVNYELVHRLKAQDTAFSLGHSEDGLFCVRFGLVTEETDLDELIGLVFSSGKEVEESTKFLETMAAVIRDGITKAEQDLTKENQEKLAQEGALRQLPVVGSLLNWWSPPSKDPVKGRTFNLSSGTLSSTEETYRYRMQVKKDAEQNAAAAAASRERTASTSSTTSSKHEAQPAPQSPQPQTSSPTSSQTTGSNQSAANRASHPSTHTTS